MKDQADMVEGRTEVLHEHISEVRDKYAHIDAVRIRQSDVNVALGAQARHLAEIDTHLSQIIRTQQEHSGRLQLLDKVEGKLDLVEGKLDRVLEHLGIAGSGAES